jgi:hypothetical protein
MFDATAVETVGKSPRFNVDTEGSRSVYEGGQMSAPAHVLSTTVHDDATMNTTGDVTLRSLTAEPFSRLHPEHKPFAPELKLEMPARQPQFVQQPKISYPGESRDDFGKRIRDGAKDKGLLRLVGLQVPLAVGLRVKPVDRGMFNALRLQLQPLAARVAITL